MARDAATEEQARARIAAQLPLAAKVAAADYVIDNGGGREETERRTDEVLGEIRNRAGKPR
jgi:dephospho-CoA kinase